MNRSNIHIYRKFHKVGLLLKWFVLINGKKNFRLKPMEITSFTTTDEKCTIQVESRFIFSLKTNKIIINKEFYEDIYLYTNVKLGFWENIPILSYFIEGYLIELKKCNKNEFDKIIELDKSKGFLLWT